MGGAVRKRERWGILYGPGFLAELAAISNEIQSDPVCKAFEYHWKEQM